ncbi:SpaA isopeptide-forming pilin-related protein [uncultured Neglectibacter sp.]|uniref:SpaA isopeptide-forming pilin-related protein n=1 Tax=uncultured Neglectibacter sp. TaxID=1924108 RepID=UPI0034DE5488
MKIRKKSFLCLTLLLIVILCISGAIPAFASIQSVEALNAPTAQENLTETLETPMICEEQPVSANGMRRAAAREAVRGTLVERHDIRCIQNPVSGLTSLGHGDGSISYQTVKALKKDGKYKVVYCLEYMKPSADGIDYSESAPSGYDEKTRALIGDIIANGWQYSGDKFGKETPFETERYKFCATQMMIWAALGGNIYYDSNGVITFKDCVSHDVELIAMQSGFYNEYYAYFFQLKNKLVALRKIPSFAFRKDTEAFNRPATLSAKDDGTFSLIVQDKNKVLDHFDFTFADGSVTAEKTGNNLKLTANGEIADSVISKKAVFEIEGGKDAFILWKTSGNYQPMVECKDNEIDPVAAYIAVQTGEGEQEEIPWESKVRFIKTDSETGRIPQGDATFAGAVYGFYDKNDTLLDTYVTDSKGEFVTKAYPAGTYYFKEISPPRGYLLSDEKAWVALTPTPAELALKNATPSELVLKEVAANELVLNGEASHSKARSKVTAKTAEDLPVNTLEVMDKTEDGFFPVKLTMKNEKGEARSDILVYFDFYGEEFLAITDENGECGFLPSALLTTLKNGGCTCLDIGQVVHGDVTPFDDTREKVLDNFLQGNEFSSSYRNIDGIKYSYPQS